LDPPPSAVMKIRRASGYFLADLLPPFFDGDYGEYRRIVADANRDPGAVVGQVVNPVGYCFAVSLAGEVVGGYLD
jgi:hypothetical protein